MQLKQSCYIAIICIVALTLSSCSKKSASNRSTRSDADIFFAKPTMQEYKRMQSETIAGFGQGGRCIDYGRQQGTDFDLSDSHSISAPSGAWVPGHKDRNGDVSSSQSGVTAHDSGNQSKLPASGTGSCSISQNTSKRLSTQQYKQKLLDVPLPVDARAIAECNDYMTVNELSISRMSSLSQQELIDFYTSMLEQSGWRLIGKIKGSSESVMTWEKPRKICVVSLRPSATKWALLKQSGTTRIVINICEKKKYN